MIARDFMTSNPAVVTMNDPIARAAEIMRDTDVGLIPVVDDPAAMHLRGVITDRDIAVRCVAAKHDARCTVGDHMSGPVLETVTPDADVSVVLQKMEQEQVRRIPVVEDGDRLVGIIAQADLARKLGPKDPEKIEELLEQVSEPNQPGS